MTSFHSHLRILRTPIPNHLPLASRLHQVANNLLTYHINHTINPTPSTTHTHTHYLPSK